MSAQAIKYRDFRSQVLEAHIPVVVGFCTSVIDVCEEVGQTLNGLAKLYAGRVKVVLVDVCEELELVGRYGIKRVPTLIVFEEGYSIGHLHGFPSRRALYELFALISRAPMNLPN